MISVITRVIKKSATLEAVLKHEAVLFYLGNQQLRGVEMVERLVARRDVIHRAIEKDGPAAYAVRHDRVEHTWP